MYKRQASFKDHAMANGHYTWSQGETLTELLSRRKEIMEKHAENLKKSKSKRKNLPLVDVFADALDDEDESTPCTVCHL